jgi:hypothetical protein
MSPEQPVYSIEFTPSGTGLRAHVRGESSLAATMAYWREIVREVHARRPESLLLVDELSGVPLAESDWRQLVIGMQGEGLEALRIAHVKPAGLQQVEFCEIFARDAGIEARVFENETLADIWLRYGER